MINMKNVDKFVRLGTFEDLWFIMILSNIHFMGHFILNLLPEFVKVKTIGRRVRLTGSGAIWPQLIERLW